MNIFPILQLGATVLAAAPAVAAGVQASRPTDAARPALTEQQRLEQDQALLNAIREGDARAVWELLAGGADPNARSTSGTRPTALMCAASASYQQKGQAAECMGLLLQAGADPNARDNRGGTALMYATGQDNGKGGVICVEGIRLLLGAGAVVQARDVSNHTALQNVAGHPGNTETLTLLLAAGADERDKNAALAAVSSHGDKDMISVLLEAGAVLLPEQAGRMLRDASASGNAEWVAWLLDHGADANAAGAYGVTPLMTARTLATAVCLVEHGADINATCADGTTPLLAISLSHAPEAEAIVKYLLQQGAKAGQGGTGRYIPCTEEELDLPFNPDILQLLVENGVDHSALTAYKNQLFYTRCNKSYFAKCARLLLQAGMDPRETNDYGETLLHRAADAGCNGIVQDLVAAGGDIDAQDLFGRTPLMEAALMCNADTARTMLEAGADVNARDSIRHTVLMYAAQGGNVDTVRVLLDAGAEVDARQPYGKTPLILAAEQGRAKVVELLLQRGADKDAQDIEGRTALMHAIRQDHPVTARRLLDAGADTSIKDFYGRSAREHVLPWKSEDIQNIFTSTPQEAQ